MKLKKAAVVTAATAGLVLAGSPAFAAPTADEAGSATIVASERADEPTFGDAFLVFIEGGGALGYGAAALIAAAYTGIALTPALIAQSFSD